ncbi:MAG TPA: lysylphosphatidylglycerol synthase domain-containing protein, partial [Hydrogenophaga sp.]|nr:lysylphosphatidylglycerol synthase domain-containing protein [Hydrogenophaga sp.]
ISQIGKYLPGNVGHFAGRAVLAKQVGIPLGVSASTILIETAWTLAIGAGFAAAALVLYVDTATALALPPIGTLELGLLTVALLFLPWLGISLVNRLAPNFSARVGGGKPVAAPRLWTAVGVSSLMVLCFFLLGWIVKLHVSGLFGVTHVGWITLTVLFTSAWLVGYVVPGAPGGLGVREAVMVLMLTPVIGAGPAVGLGVTVRLATLVGDGLAFLLGMWIKRLN